MRTLKKSLLALESPASLSVDTGRMSATATLSTPRRDREGDVLIPQGVDTTNHQSNPCVLLNHAAHHELPIGVTRSPEGEYTVYIQPDRIVETTYFSQRCPVAAQAFQLCAEKILVANSIGFRPVVTKALAPDREQGLPAGQLIEASELIEISWCAIGVSPDAVMRSLDHGVEGRPLHASLKAMLLPLAPPKKQWAHGWSQKADLPEPPARVQRYESGSVARQQGEPWGAYQARLARINASAGGTPADKLAISNRTRKPAPKEPMGPGPRRLEEKPGRERPAPNPNDFIGHEDEDTKAVDMVRKDIEDDEPRLSRASPSRSQGSGDHYIDALDRPLKERMDEIGERDEWARVHGRPTFHDRVHQALASHHDTARGMRQSETAVADPRINREPTPPEELKHRAVRHFLEGSTENAPHVRRLDSVLRELHDTNRGTVSAGEMLALHQSGHFTHQTPKQAEAAIEGRRRPEGWTHAPGGSDNGEQADKEPMDEKKTLEPVGDETRDELLMRQHGSYDERVARQRADADSRRNGSRNGWNDFSDAERAAASGGSHDYSDEDVIRERNPKYSHESDRPEAVGSTVESPKHDAANDAPTGQYRKPKEEGKSMDDHDNLPLGAASLLSLHRQLSDLHGSLGGQMGIHEPEVAKLLGKLHQHIGGAAERCGEVFAGRYPDHKGMLCSKKDMEPEEGGEGERLKGVEEDYQGGHPAPSAMSGRMPQERSQDYFNGPEKVHGGHRFGAERPLTETEMDIQEPPHRQHYSSDEIQKGGTRTRPAVEPMADRDEADETTAYLNRTHADDPDMHDPHNDPFTRADSPMLTPHRHPRGGENSRHGPKNPQDWQTAYGGADNGERAQASGTELRDSRGRKRSDAELDAAWEREAGHAYDPRRAAQLIMAARKERGGKSLDLTRDEEQELDRLERSLLRKAKMIGLQA